MGGPPNQATYLNAVVRWRPAAAWASPERALAALLAVEAALGRRRRERWGPRRIDLDLLDGAGWRPAPRRAGAVAPTQPHPRAAERAFVLVPWAEVAPGWPLASGMASASVAERAARLDRSGVRPADAATAAAWARAVAAAPGAPSAGSPAAAAAPVRGRGAGSDAG